MFSYIEVPHTFLDWIHIRVKEKSLLRSMKGRDSVNILKVKIRLCDKINDNVGST